MSTAASGRKAVAVKSKMKLRKEWIRQHRDIYVGLAATAESEWQQLQAVMPDECKTEMQRAVIHLENVRDALDDRLKGACKMTSALTGLLPKGFAGFGCNITDMSMVKPASHHGTLPRGIARPRGRETDAVLIKNPPPGLNAEGFWAAA